MTLSSVNVLPGLVAVLELRRRNARNKIEKTCHEKCRGLEDDEREAIREREIFIFFWARVLVGCVYNFFLRRGEVFI